MNAAANADNLMQPPRCAVFRVRYLQLSSLSACFLPLVIGGHLSHPAQMTWFDYAMVACIFANLWRIFADTVYRVEIDDAGVCLNQLFRRRTLRWERITQCSLRLEIGVFIFRSRHSYSSLRDCNGLNFDDAVLSYKDRALFQAIIEERLTPRLLDEARKLDEQRLPIHFGAIEWDHHLGLTVSRWLRPSVRLPFEKLGDCRTEMANLALYDRECKRIVKILLGRVANLSVLLALLDERRAGKDAATL